MVFTRQAPKKQQPPAAPNVATTKPTAAAAKSPEPIPDLKPEMSLWGSGTTNNHGYAPVPQYQPPHHEFMQPEFMQTEFIQPSAQQQPIASRKIMSLEEVEADILAQSQRPPQPIVPQPIVPQVRPLPPISDPPQLQHYNPDQQLFPPPAQYTQHIETPPPHHFLTERRLSPQPPSLFNQGRPPPHVGTHSPAIPAGLPSGVPTGMPHGIPALAQLQNQSEADRARMLEEESRRLKRNHKIAQLVSYCVRLSCDGFGLIVL